MSHFNLLVLVGWIIHSIPVDRNPSQSMVVPCRSFSPQKGQSLGAMIFLVFILSSSLWRVRSRRNTIPAFTRFRKSNRNRHSFTDSLMPKLSYLIANKSLSRLSCHGLSLHIHTLDRLDRRNTIHVPSHRSRLHPLH